MSLFLFHHFFVEHLDVETPRSSGSRASEIVLELDLVPMANGGWSKGFTIKIGDWKGTKNRGMILINGVCLDDLWHRFTQRNHLTLKYGKSPDLRTDVLKKITSESPNFSWGMFPSYVKLSPQRPGLATSGPRWPRGTNTLQSVIAKNKKKRSIFSHFVPCAPGWWYTYPSEKWWSSSVGMMIIPNIWKNEIHVPSHQPVKDVQRCAKMFNFLMFIFSPCRITWTENHQPDSHYH